ncbi:uncharacterized protein LOC134773471 [Penaeus indicus]|uniref:uncharacterized protein LOC134773471 n=1 Tax=Penaeus indicus TaxID=29960 RepID=UPI00300D2423
MQQRIEYLERQVPSLVPTAPHGSPAHNGPTVPDFPRNEAPVTEDSEPNDKSVEDHQPSVEDVDEYNTPVEHVVEVEQKDPQTPVPEKEPEDFPVPSDPDLSVGYDDDEDHGEGSGDDECQVLSRPVCPVGYRICQTTHRCPRPVCCK